MTASTMTNVASELLSVNSIETRGRDHSRVLVLLSWDWHLLLFPVSVSVSVCVYSFLFSYD